MRSFKQSVQTAIAFVFFLVAVSSAEVAGGAAGRTLFPGHNAADVNPDTHLKIVFERGNTAEIYPHHNLCCGPSGNNAYAAVQV